MQTKILKIKLLFLIIIFCSCFSVSADEVQFRKLFQNRFFILSQNSELLCATSEEHYFSNEKLKQVIDYYESINPDLRRLSVQLLTKHTNPKHLEDIAESTEKCANNDAVDLCVLTRYWDSYESALRVLALFYDTKTIILHNTINLFRIIIYKFTRSNFF